MNIGVSHLITIRGRHQLDALPLPRRTIVRQIIEHTVDAIASHHHLLACHALRLERAIHLQASILMEVERSASPHGECSEAIHTHTTIYHHRLGSLDERISGDAHIAHQDGIPRVGVQIQFLLHPTLQGEDQVVLYLLRQVGMLRMRGKFYEHTDAVALAHLHIAGLKSRRLTQEGAIHIDTEARLVAILQPDGGTTQALVCTIVYPEGCGRRRHIGKRSIERHRIDRERKHITTQSREALVLGTRCHHGHRHRTHTYIK